MEDPQKAIRKIYVNNIDMFKRNAYFILKKFYSIPLDEEDLINLGFNVFSSKYIIKYINWVK
ncbi:MAG: hypothetical protein ACRC1F_01015 [Metamycoplasmataceae bacterium]